MAKKNNKVRQDLIARWTKIMGKDSEATFDAIYATGADNAEAAITTMESKLKKSGGGNGSNKVVSLKNIVGTNDAVYEKAADFIGELYPEADDAQALAITTALYHAMDEIRRGVQYSSNLMKTFGSTDDTVEKLYEDGNIGFNANFLEGVRHLTATVRRVDNYLEEMGITDNADADEFDPTAVKPRGAKYTNRDEIFEALGELSEVAKLFVEPAVEEVAETEAVAAE